MTDTILDHLNANASANGTIGAVAFWSLRGTRMRRTDLRAALDSLDLGFAMPKDPKPQALLRMAVDHARKAQPGIVFDRVHQTAAEIVYAMSARHTDEAAELAQYQHRTRVRLDRSSGQLTLEDTQDVVLQAVAARYQELQEWITVTEVGSVLINALRGRKRHVGMAAVNLRGESGGVYFVPATNVGTLTGLANAIDALGQQGALTVWPVPRGDRAVAQAAQAAASDFGARLAEAKLDVQALVQALAGDATDGADRSEQRVLARAQQFTQLRTRIEVYADLLGDVRSDLVDQVAALEAQLKDRLAATLGDGTLADDDGEEEAA